MRFLLAITASLQLAKQTFSLASIPFVITREADIQTAFSKLIPLLSPNATVTFPNEDTWAPLQIRGSSPRIRPNYQVVVEVATEQDVANTVTMANRFNIPFLAVSGTHGWTKTLNGLHYGIQVNMRKLNTITVDSGGKSATVGGGTLQWELTKALFAQNKQAVTGLCECVSIIGPLMGGGHSMLQARYGFALDNIISARVVLANGTALTISETSHADLFWALRGAGHNFFAVTSMQLNIYNVQDNWTVYSLIYTQNKLEQLVSLINRVDSAVDRPANVVYNGVITRIPNVDAENPVIGYTIAYEGPPANAFLLATPFLILDPTVTQISTNVTYTALYNITQNSLSSPACRRNHNVMGTGASLPSYNTTAARAAFAIFAELTADPRFNTSVLLLENYGMKGVKKVDPETTALAREERRLPVVINPTIWWEGVDEEAEAEAEVFGERIREAWYEGAVAVGRHTYVNYASGTEGVRQLYGHEGWRVERLRGLKRSIDPNNGFGFYNSVLGA